MEIPDIEAASIVNPTFVDVYAFMKTWKPNALFRSGPNWRLNACVGNSGGPYDFSDYGSGFFRGAKEMVAGVYQDRFIVDTAVYPIVFCYRHGIELHLKYLLQLSSSVTRTHTSYARNHKLQDNWAAFAKACTSASWPFVNKTELSMAGDIIDEFCEIDPTGQVFRYPEDIKGNQHLTGLSVINIEVLKEGMEILEEFLEKWISELQACLDMEAEQRKWAGE